MDPAIKACRCQEHAVAARQRVRRALNDVGPDYANILMNVCCLDCGLRDVEQSQGWPQRSGKVVLQLALRALARHYGLISDHVGSANPSSAIRHWGDESYRPDMS